MLYCKACIYFEIVECVEVEQRDSLVLHSTIPSLNYFTVLEHHVITQDCYH